VNRRLFLKAADFGLLVSKIKKTQGKRKKKGVLQSPYLLYLLNMRNLTHVKIDRDIKARMRACDGVE
jgi:hypothetical protein